MCVTSSTLPSLSLPLFLALYSHPISNRVWHRRWNWSFLSCKYWAPFLKESLSLTQHYVLMSIKYALCMHCTLTEKNPPLFSFDSLTGRKSLMVLLCLKVGEEGGKVDGEEARWCGCGGLEGGEVNWSSASASSSSSSYRNKQIITMGFNKYIHSLYRQWCWFITSIRLVFCVYKLPLQGIHLLCIWLTG